MHKTKNIDPSHFNQLHNKATAIAAAGSLLVPAALYSLHSKNSHKNNIASTPTLSSPSSEVMQHLDGLLVHNPNIVDVSQDTAHPGLEKVTYRFTPSHNTLSDVYYAVSPNQDTTHAEPILEGYNGGNEITHNGNKISIDVDSHTGYIVPNPETSHSAGSGE